MGGELSLTYRVAACAKEEKHASKKEVDTQEGLAAPSGVCKDSHDLRHCP